jgi:NAD+ kinase
MIKTIGVIANPKKKKAIAYQKKVAAFLKKKRIKVITDQEVLRREVIDKADLIIALGGDGTLLNIVKYINKKIDVLGINLGGFGFLTEIKTSEIKQALEEVLLSKYTISLRQIIKASVYRNNKLLKSFKALNDIVINKGSLSRILTLELSIEGEKAASYLCDGLIMATATGSTAHSLSAGGPILHPEVDAFVVTPVCPHTLSNRPLVLSSAAGIQVRVISQEAKDVALVADGQAGINLKTGDVIKISKARRPFRLITSSKRSYFAILNEKLKWGKAR